VRLYQNVAVLLFALHLASHLVEVSVGLIHAVLGVGRREGAIRPRCRRSQAKGLESSACATAPPGAAASSATAPRRMRLTLSAPRPRFNTTCGLRVPNSPSDGPEGRRAQRAAQGRPGVEGAESREVGSVHHGGESARSPSSSCSPPSVKSFAQALSLGGYERLQACWLERTPLPLGID
jgi:hypothetical protein